MESRLTLPQHLDDDNAFNFIEALWQHQHCDTLTLDFSKLEYALPFGTLVLAVALRDFTSRKTGRTLQAAQVDESGKHSYLSHVGFFKVAGFPIGKRPGQATGSATYLPITVLTLKELQERRTAYQGERGKLKPIGFFIQRESERLALLVTQENKEKINAPIAYCFREIIRNVFEHGETDRCGIFAQRWADGSIEIAIIDRGQGVLNSLRDKYTFDTDYEALRFAVQPGVSGKDTSVEGDEWANSGFGLYVLSELGRRLGSFALCSGTAGLVARDGQFSAQPYHLRSGTAVKLLVNRPKGTNFWDYIQSVIDEGEEFTTRTGRPAKASRSTRVTGMDDVDDGGEILS